MPAPAVRALALALGLAAGWLPAGASGAQIPGLDAWSEAVSAGVGRRWEGPRVEPAPPVGRPTLPVAARSFLLPVAVHAPEAVPAERVEASLRALEAAWLGLEAAGWGTPWADGGRGDTAGFDLYLTDRVGALDASGQADPPVAWSFLDGVSSWATVDPSVDPEDLGACVTDAYAQALLLGLDPAEAQAWRRATAAFLTLQLTGQWGCGRWVIDQQREPWRSWIDGAAGEGAGGALFLAMLSARHDRGTGTFIRDLWQLARQRTWEGNGLRASPDLWEALEAAVDRSSDDLIESIEDFAVARWFGGDRARERHAPMRIVRALPSEAVVPHVGEAAWSELPRYLPEAEPPLEPFGSGYARVDTSEAPPGKVLRIWLRGEFGVEWSLVAVRRDARGRELARLSAPPRREPRSYLVVELEEDTAEVIVVVTNLSSRLPDADEPDENVRSFQLIVSDRHGAAPD